MDRHSGFRFIVFLFVKDAHRMRYVQAAASLLWIAYGVILKAPPIIVANVIVAALAVGSTLRKPVAIEN